MTIETSGMNFVSPDLALDTMEEPKYQRYAELVARALPQPEPGDASREAQKKRAAAFLAGRYAADNAVDVRHPLLHILIQAEMIDLES